MDYPALKWLSQKQFDGLSNEVQGYFAVLSLEKKAVQKEQAGLDHLYSFTIAFLTQSTRLLSNDKAPLEPEVVKSIEHCCHGYSKVCKLVSVDGAKVVTNMKIILYIVSKLSGKVNLTTHISLGTCILESLLPVSSPEPNEQLDDLATKFYSYFWNAAIGFERLGQATPLQVCELRFLSLRVLALRVQPSAIESCLDKSVLALNVFEHKSCGKTSPHSKESSCAEKQKNKLSSGQSSANRGTKKSGGGDMKDQLGKERDCEQSLKERNSDKDSPSQDRLTALSLTLTLLDGLFCLGQPANAVSILKLCTTVYDFLAGAKLEDHMSLLKIKLCNGDKVLVTSSTRSAVIHFLDLTRIVELLSEGEEEEELTQHECHELYNLLCSTLVWAKQFLGRQGQSIELSVESFHWFVKQLKARKIRGDIFAASTSIGDDSLAQLLGILKEVQMFLASAGDADDGPGLVNKEEMEKHRKTQLDAHQCFLTLSHRSLTQQLPHLKNDSLAEVLSQLEGQVNSYKSAIDKLTSSDVELNQRYFLGSMCLKLGHRLYNQNLEKEAIMYYIVACQQLTRWCMADPKLVDTKLEESSLLKVYNYLSQSQHKVGRLEDAMATVTKAFATCCHSANDAVSSQLISTWVKLKRSAVKDGGDGMEKHFGRSFGDDPTCDTNMLCHCIQVELSWLLSGALRPRLWSVEEALLKRYVELGDQTKVKDVGQILLLQFDVLTKASPTIGREEIVQCLDTMTTRYPDDHCLQAELYFIRFCLQVKAKVELPLPESSDEENLTVGAPAVGNHVKMIGEEERGLVKAALSLCELALKQQGTNSIADPAREVQRRMFRDLLIMVADILMVCREFLLQLEVLAVAKNLSGDCPKNDFSIADINASIVDALASIGVDKVPPSLTNLIQGLDKNCKEAGFPEKELELLEKGVGLPDKRTDSLLLSFINFYSKTGKVTEMHRLLNQFRDKCTKSNMSSLLCGKFHRTLGQCLHVAPPECSDSNMDNYVLLSAQQAYAFHFAVFSRVSGEEGMRLMNQAGEDTLWRKLMELLQSTLFLGRAYRHSGDARRSRLYLKEGFALATKFGLLKWRTLFGLEVAAVLSDSESLLPMVDILKSTYTHFSRIEPSTSNPSSLLPRKTSSATTVTPNSLIEEYSIAHAEEQDNSHDKESSQAGFWQRMQVYQKQKSKDTARAGLDQEIVDLSACIGFWCRSLVNHPSGCWCQTCNDAESQLLVLTLAQMSIKAAHRHGNCFPAEHRLEHFFSHVLRHFRRVDPSGKLTELMQSSGIVLESEVVNCGDWQYLICLTELSLSLAETNLHRHHVPQALSHLSAALLVLNSVPQHSQEAVLLRARLAHLHAVCLFKQRKLQQTPLKKTFDWKDSWTLLTDSQLAAQVQAKLEKLQICRKTDKAPHNLGTSSVSDVATDGQAGRKAASLAGQTSACGRDRIRKVSPGLGSVQGSPRVLSGKPGDERTCDSRASLSEELGMTSSLVPLIKSKLSTGSKTAEKKGNDVVAELSQTPSVTNDAVVIQVVSEKNKSKSRKTKKCSSDMYCDESQQSLTDKDSKPAIVRSLTTPQSSSQLTMSGSIPSTKSRESAAKVSAPQPASQAKQKLKKKSNSARALSRILGSTEEQPALSHINPVVLKLFSESTINQTPISKHTPQTPSSVIKQILSCSAKFSDSEDEFKPATPVSTPRLNTKLHQHKSSRTSKMSGSLPSRLMKSRKLPSQSAKKTPSVDGEDAIHDSSEPGSVVLKDTKLGGKSSKRKPLSNKTTAVQDTETLEAVEKDPYSLDLSQQDGASPVQNDGTAEETVVSSKPSNPSQARLSQNRELDKGTAEDIENANCRIAPASIRKSSKVLSENNSTSIYSKSAETTTEGKDTLSPLVEGKKSEAAARGKGKQTRNSRAAGKASRVLKQLVDDISMNESQHIAETDIGLDPPPPSGNKTKRSGRKPKECGEPPGEPPRGRRATDKTRASKDKAPSRRRGKVEMMPEIETVMGGGEEETEPSGDVFDFVESDSELPGSSSVKGKKGSKAKSTGVKKAAGRSAKQVTSRTDPGKVSDKSKKTSTSKSKLDCYAPKPVASSKSKKPAEVVSSVRQLDSGLPSDKTTVKQKVQTQAPLNILTDLHADLTSIETVRHVLTPQSALHESHDSSSQSNKESCQCRWNGCKGCGKLGNLPVSTVPQSETGKAWHLESLLAFFENHGKCLEGIEDVSIAAASLQNTELTDAALQDVQANLSKSLAQIQHFPSVPVYSETCKMLAQIKLDRGGDSWEIAALLGESAAVALRHQFLAHCQKQLRQKMADDGEKQRQKALARNLGADFHELLFPWDVDRYRTAAQAIPQGWAVCQFSVADSPGGCSLMLTRMTSDHEPITVDLPGFSDQQGQMIYFEFHNILKSSDETIKIHDKSMWWNNRVALDTKLENLLEGMEKHWLGPWKGLLVGQTSDPVYNKAMTSLAATLGKVIHKITGQQCSTEKARQVLDLMQHTKDLPTILPGVLKQKDLRDNTALITAVTSEVLKNLPSAVTSDLPVIFILDKHLANLPLEQLKVTRDQPITRVPSLALLHHLLKLHHTGRGDGNCEGSHGQGNGATGSSMGVPANKKSHGTASSVEDESSDRSNRKNTIQGSKGGSSGSQGRKGGGSSGTDGNSDESSVPSVAQRGVDPTSVFYVLNPDGDLQHTQGFLKAPFESFEGWKGVTASVPTTEQYTQALTQHDMFVYSGHGSGCKYFSREEILKIRCRAVLLLFGCSSVHVDLYTNLDPDAYFYSYLLAGSPCVLGNLWDVTDRDMDLFCLHLLNLWLKEERTQPSLSLASLVQKARDTTRLRWLNGSSPVVYGLPVSLVTRR